MHLYSVGGAEISLFCYSDFSRLFRVFVCFFFTRFFRCFLEGCFTHALRFSCVLVVAMFFPLPFIHSFIHSVIHSFWLNIPWICSTFSNKTCKWAQLVVYESWMPYSYSYSFLVFCLTFKQTFKSQLQLMNTRMIECEREPSADYLFVFMCDIVKNLRQVYSPEKNIILIKTHTHTQSMLQTFINYT